MNELNGTHCLPVTETILPLIFPHLNKWLHLLSCPKQKLDVILNSPFTSHISSIAMYCYVFLTSRSVPLQKGLSSTWARIILPISRAFRWSLVGSVKVLVEMAE